MHLATSIAAYKGVTSMSARIGDPYGRFEKAADLSAYARELRAKPYKVSRNALLLTADYEVACAILKSPMASASVPEPQNWIQHLVLGPARSDDRTHPVLDSLVTYHGEDHQRLRKLLQPAFSHRAMREWREATERICAQLLDQFDDGPVDLVSQWAAPLPMAVICQILGVPFEDRDRFRAWGNVLAAGLDRPRSMKMARELDAAAGELLAYLDVLLAQRRADPQDDFLSTLANVNVDGDVLTDKEIITTAAFLLIAGFETTVNLLGAGTNVLMRHPAQFELLATDHDLIPNAIEELLRYVSPVQFTFRTAFDDIELPDAEVLARGGSAAILLVGANRDPRVFDDPERLDLTRENARKHLAFGFGPHLCLGAALARMEADVAWRSLLSRYPHVAQWQFAGEPRGTEGRMVRGLQSLPVTL